MNTVSNTAYYCCGIRMLDAEHPSPICNDTYANLFMDEKGLAIFEPFRSETMPNISNATRCRIIDDHLRNEISKKPDTVIITVGAGFDSRPFRLTGGEWIEIDEPSVMAIKDEKLPIEQCSNNLNRISIEFDRESLDEKLASIDSSRPIVFVIEGVFMYLEESTINQTIQQLQSRFPRHSLYCDLMSKTFFKKFAQSVHNKLVSAGGTFTQRPENPAGQFFECGYLLKSHVPMLHRAYESGTLWQRLKMPRLIGWLVLNVFLKDLQGYAVHHFQYGTTD